MDEIGQPGQDSTAVGERLRNESVFPRPKEKALYWFRNNNVAL
jgi:hypothetical protein